MFTYTITCQMYAHCLSLLLSCEILSGRGYLCYLYIPIASPDTYIYHHRFTFLIWTGRKKRKEFARPKKSKKATWARKATRVGVGGSSRNEAEKC